MATTLLQRSDVTSLGLDNYGGRGRGTVMSKREHHRLETHNASRYSTSYTDMKSAEPLVTISDYDNDAYDIYDIDDESGTRSRNISGSLTQMKGLTGARNRNRGG